MLKESKTNNNNKIYKYRENYENKLEKNDKNM